MTMTRILCIDDDRYLTDLLRYGFAREGFDVSTVDTAREGLRRARMERFDAILLDVNIPDMNGLKALAALRTFTTIPVIVLTARALDEDIIAGFDGGADDYVLKPFSMQPLVARVKAVLRRVTVRSIEPAPYADRRIRRIGGASLDMARNELMAEGGACVRLTPTESRILQLLLAHEGQVLSAERIMERIWSYNSASDIAVVKTHIRRLRAKILRLPGGPQPIRTVPGVGYMLAPASDAGAVEQLAALA